MTEPSGNKHAPFLHIEFTSTLRVDGLDDPVEQTVDHNFRVFFFIDDDQETDAGHGSFVEIPAYYDPDDPDQGADNYDAMDAHSSETYELHEAILTNLDTFTDAGVQNPVYLEKLFIKPEFQGRGFGTQALRRLMHHWGRHGGNPSHIFVLAFPIDPEQGTNESQWQFRDPKGFQEAKTRVCRFYERLGFRALGKTDFMAFDLTYRIPD